MTTPIPDSIEKIVEELVKTAIVTNGLLPDDVRSALLRVRTETLKEADELATKLMNEYANTPLTPPSLRGTGFDWLWKLRQALRSLYQDKETK